MIYQKLYARLVSGVDDSLEMVDSFLKQENCGREELSLVAGKLQQALHDVEELHIKAQEVFQESLSDLLKTMDPGAEDKALQELGEIFAELGPVSPPMFTCVVRLAQIIAGNDLGVPEIDE